MSKSKIPVAIDTMTLVWGVRKKGDQEYLRRAKLLLDELSEIGARIIVPSVVVSEYLTFIKEDDKPRVLAQLCEQFFVPPFDAKCALVASSLWRSAKGEKLAKPNARVCLRADTLIVATAKVNGAARFYSHDVGCRKLAEKLRMNAFDLPKETELLIPKDNWGPPN